MAKKEQRLPHKTTINLAMREQDPNRPIITIPLMLVVLLAVLVFGKFAVADRMAGVERLRSAVSDSRAYADKLTAQTAEYGAVTAEYGKYSSGWMTDEEKARFDSMEALELVETQLAGVGQIERFSVANNVLSVDLTGVTLASTSDLVSRFENLEGVASVEVYTAGTQVKGGTGTSVSMIISLQTEESIRQKSEPPPAPVAPAEGEAPT